MLAERASGERPASEPPTSAVTVTASKADFLAGVGRVSGLDTRLTDATAGVREVGGGGGAAIASPPP